MKSEQELFNEMLEKTPLKLAPKEEFLELLHIDRNQSSNTESYDPIENAMKRHPMLTEEKAEEMAKAFGF
jgi:hypothetical protein